MGRGSRIVAAAVAASLLAGCVTDPGRRRDKRLALDGRCKVAKPAPPPSGHRIAGCVTDSHGKPVAHTVVGLEYVPGFGDLMAFVGGTVFSLGVGCLAGICTAPGGNATGTARGGDDGRFVVELPEKARHGRYLATVLAPDAGSSVAVMFGVGDDTRSVTLPPLLAWRPAFRVEHDGQWAVPVFERLPGDKGKQRYDLVLNDGERDVVTVEGVTSGQRIDGRMFQDVHGSLMVTASGRAGDGDAAYRTAPVLWRHGPVPASRLTPCRVHEGTGRTQSYSGLVTCRATDGELKDDISDSGLGHCSFDGCTGAAWVEIDLLATTAVGSVVVHGATGGTVVEVSGDRRHWREVGRHAFVRPTSVPYAIDLAPGIRARYVRLVAERTVSGIAEVSVFTP